MKTIAFTNDGTDFGALDRLRRWCDENDFALGSTQGSDPIGLMAGKESWSVAKWRNLNAQEREQLAGVAYWRDGGPRDGNCVVELR